MGIPSRALDFVAPHCDILERLELVPPSASCRGVYFRNVEAQVERAGRSDEYRAFFPGERFTAITFYPLCDYLVRIACAGALVASPERVHDGMFEIARSNSTTFAKSLLGRALFRLLARDPVRLTEQGLAARRQSCSYGHWSIVRHGTTALEMVYADEYQWIESVIHGAARGTFEACGIEARVETKLRDRFSGSTFIRWS